MVLGGELRGPAILDHDGLVRLDDDGRAGDALPSRHRLAPDDRRLVPLPFREEAGALGDLGLAAVLGRRSLLEVGAAADGLDLDGLDDQRLGLVHEAEAGLVRRLEGVLHLGTAYRTASRSRCRCRHSGYERGHGWRYRLPARPALPPRLRLGAQPVGDHADRGLGAGVERYIERGGTGGADFGEAHAIGRKQAGERMQQHRLDAERIGDEAGMLAAGAAKGVQRIAGDIIAALDRDLLDRLGHVGDGDLDEAVGDLLGRAAIADLASERCELLAHGRDIERLVAGRDRRSPGNRTGSACRP
jgi:hypothetical protein